MTGNSAPGAATLKCRLAAQGLVPLYKHIREFERDLGYLNELTLKERGGHYGEVIPNTEPNDIRNVVKRLHNKGWLHNTINEEHFKVTMEAFQLCLLNGTVHHRRLCE
jgi:hypothetical protein